MQDDNELATKADVRAVQTNVDRVETSLTAEMRELRTEMNTRFEHVHEDIGRVLDVVINMDKKFTVILDRHDRDIRRLKKHTGLELAA
jgi:hypothetical protein